MYRKTGRAKTNESENYIGTNKNWQTEDVLPKVINLSKKVITSNELSILKKGLTFTHTPKQNINEWRLDIKKCCRRLRPSDI